MILSPLRRVFERVTFLHWDSRCTYNDGWSMSRRLVMITNTVCGYYTRAFILLLLFKVCFLEHFRSLCFTSICGCACICSARVSSCVFVCSPVCTLYMNELVYADYRAYVLWCARACVRVCHHVPVSVYLCKFNRTLYLLNLKVRSSTLYYLNYREQCKPLG